jgi:hypothetical protein
MFFLFFILKILSIMFVLRKSWLLNKLPQFELREFVIVQGKFNYCAESAS